MYQYQQESGLLIENYIIHLFLSRMTTLPSYTYVIFLRIFIPSRNKDDLAPKIECHAHKEKLTNAVPLNKPRGSSRREESGKRTSVVRIRAKVTRREKWFYVLNNKLIKAGNGVTSINKERYNCCTQ